ncbi:MAG TPA: glycosyltransferase family 2 protein [Burkholderiales bacterium]|nr:glycosyltransferase family 2 protein [Burkholderiales bacterium]
MNAVAAVIPAFNEEATIRGVVERTLRQVARVIVVDDGSSDRTALALGGLPVTVLRNERNRGKARSLIRGMEEAFRLGADAVVTLDGDGQHPPEEIPRLLSAQRAEPRSIAIGSRLHDAENIPLDRYLANCFANFWIAWAAGQRVEDSQSGFRVYSDAAWREVVSRCSAEGFVFESEVLIEAGRAGFSLLAVPVPAVYGARARRSHFHPVLDVVRITRMVAWKLLARGLYLSGLVRLVRADRLQRADASRETGPMG